MRGGTHRPIKTWGDFIMRKSIDTRNMDELRLSEAIVITGNLFLAHGPEALALEIVAVANKHNRLCREGAPGMPTLTDRIRAAFKATAALTLEERILLGLVYSEFLTDGDDAHALEVAASKTAILCEAIGVDAYALWLAVEHKLNGRTAITK